MHRLALLQLVCMILTVGQLDRLLEDASKRKSVTWNCEHLLTHDRDRPKRCCSLQEDWMFETFVTYDDGAQLDDVADNVEASVRKGRRVTL